MNNYYYPSPSISASVGVGVCRRRASSSPSPHPLSLPTTSSSSPWSITQRRRIGGSVHPQPASQPGSSTTTTTPPRWPHRPPAPVFPITMTSRRSWASKYQLLQLFIYPKTQTIHFKCYSNIKMREDFSAKTVQLGKLGHDLLPPGSGSETLPGHGWLLVDWPIGAFIWVLVAAQSNSLYRQRQPEIKAHFPICPVFETFSRCFT